ncbi:hypothetical protein GW17_00013841 [Ensete ventricosum]|nr:hypothetical protein GW17_00013841 [Ensete ventricosum]
MRPGLSSSVYKRMNSKDFVGDPDRADDVSEEQGCHQILLIYVLDLHTYQVKCMRFSICGIIMSYSQVAYPSFLTGSVVAMLLMDILGRKFLLAGSFLGMVKSVLAFSLGAGPVPSLLLPEIFPNKIRAKAVALCMSVHWVMTVVNFFVGLFFLRLLELLGAKILYSIFASFCLMGAIFVRKNVVETKGKTLQEIEVALLSAV